MDAVVITTPDHWHALPTIHACKAGKDVYCEKPLTLTVAEGRAMVKAARKHNRDRPDRQPAAVEYKGNFRIAVRAGPQRQARQAQERQGRHRRASTSPSKAVAGATDGPPPPELDYDFWLGPAPLRPYNANRVHYMFRFFWDYSGGQLTNWGPTTSTSPSGPWAWTRAARSTIERHGDATTRTGCTRCRSGSEMTYTYANGVTVAVRPGSYKGGCTFEGEKGTIYVDRSKLEVDAGGAAQADAAATTDDAAVRRATATTGNWLECIKSRKPPICDVEIGHRSATVCHLGNIAMRTGRTITLGPGRRSRSSATREAAAMLSRPYRKPWELPSVA